MKKSLSTAADFLRVTADGVERMESREIVTEYGDFMSPEELRDTAGQLERAAQDPFVDVDEILGTLQSILHEARTLQSQLTGHRAQEWQTAIEPLEAATEQLTRMTEWPTSHRSADEIQGMDVFSVDGDLNRFLSWARGYPDYEDVSGEIRQMLARMDGGSAALEDSDYDLVHELASIISRDARVPDAVKARVASAAAEFARLDPRRRRSVRRSGDWYLEVLEGLDALADELGGRRDSGIGVEGESAAWQFREYQAAQDFLDTVANWDGVRDAKVSTLREPGNRDLFRVYVKVKEPGDERRSVTRGAQPTYVEEIQTALDAAEAAGYDDLILALKQALEYVAKGEDGAVLGYLEDAVASLPPVDGSNDDLRSQVKIANEAALDALVKDGSRRRSVTRGVSRVRETAKPLRAWAKREGASELVVALDDLLEGVRQGDLGWIEQAWRDASQAMNKYAGDEDNDGRELWDDFDEAVSTIHYGKSVTRSGDALETAKGLGLELATMAESLPGNAEIFGVDGGQWRWKGGELFNARTVKQAQRVISWMERHRDELSGFEGAEDMAETLDELLDLELGVERSVTRGVRDFADDFVEGFGRLAESLLYWQEQGQLWVNVVNEVTTEEEERRLASEFAMAAAETATLVVDLLDGVHKFPATFDDRGAVRMARKALESGRELVRLYYAQQEFYSRVLPENMQFEYEDPNAVAMEQYEADPNPDAAPPEGMRPLKPARLASQLMYSGISGWFRKNQHAMTDLEDQLERLVVWTEIAAYQDVPEVAMKSERPEFGIPLNASPHGVAARIRQAIEPVPAKASDAVKALGYIADNLESNDVQGAYEEYGYFDHGSWTREPRPIVDVVNDLEPWFHEQLFDEDAPGSDLLVPKRSLAKWSGILLDAELVEAGADVIYRAAEQRDERALAEALPQFAERAAKLGPVAAQIALDFVGDVERAASSLESEFSKLLDYARERDWDSRGTSHAVEAVEALRVAFDSGDADDFDAAVEDVEGALGAYGDAAGSIDELEAIRRAFKGPRDEPVQRAASPSRVTSRRVVDAVAAIWAEYTGEAPSKNVEVYADPEVSGVYVARVDGDPRQTFLVNLDEGEDSVEEVSPSSWPPKSAGNNLNVFNLSAPRGVVKSLSQVYDRYELLVDAIGALAQAIASGELDAEFPPEFPTTAELREVQESVEAAQEDPTISLDDAHDAALLVEDMARSQVSMAERDDGSGDLADAWNEIALCAVAVRAALDRMSETGTTHRSVTRGASQRDALILRALNALEMDEVIGDWDADELRKLLVGMRDGLQFDAGVYGDAGSMLESVASGLSVGPELEDALDALIALYRGEERSVPRAGNAPDPSAAVDSGFQSTDEPALTKQISEGLAQLVEIFSVAGDQQVADEFSALQEAFDAGGADADEMEKRVLLELGGEHDDMVQPLVNAIRDLRELVSA